MALSPQFIKNPFLWQALVSAEAPERNDPVPGGAWRTVFLGKVSDKGGVIESLWLIPLGSHPATTLRLWLRKPSDVVPQLLREFAIAAATLTNSSASQLPVTLPNLLMPPYSQGLRLGAGAEIYVSLGIAAAPGFQVGAQGGHYGEIPVFAPPTVDPAPLDSATQAFLTAAGITDSVLVTAINNLVLGLKSNGTWGKKIAIYPLVGGTSSSCIVNLKSPGTFDLTISGTFAFAASGVTGGGPNTLSTGIDLSILDSASCSLSIYLRDAVNTFSGHIGADTGQGLFMGLNWGDGNYKIRYGFNELSGAGSPVGLNTMSRFSGDLNYFRNGSAVASSSPGAPSFDPGLLYVLGSSGGSSSSAEAAYADVGAGLSTGEMAADYATIQAFQTALSRQV
jgi:hypothetical protein